MYARAPERVAEESVARARTLLERNEQLQALQLVANIDVLTARQAVAVRAALLTQTQQALAGALRGRLDLREADLQVDRSRVGAEVARDGLRVSLNLSGSYTALTNNVSTLRPLRVARDGDVASAGWQGGVSVTVPVGNNIAKAGLQQAILVQSQQEAAVPRVQNQEVRQALRAIQMSGDRVRQTTEALELGTDQRRAAGATSGQVQPR